MRQRHGGCGDSNLKSVPIRGQAQIPRVRDVAIEKRAGEIPPALQNAGSPDRLH
jgi:hypothetical protein